MTTAETTSHPLGQYNTSEEDWVFNSLRQQITMRRHVIVLSPHNPFRMVGMIAMIHSRRWMVNENDGRRKSFRRFLSESITHTLVHYETTRLSVARNDCGLHGILAWGMQENQFRR